MVVLSNNNVCVVVTEPRLPSLFSRYNVPSDSWSTSTPMHTYRSAAGAATLNGQVYVIGMLSSHLCILTAILNCGSRYMYCYGN